MDPDQARQNVGSDLDPKLLGPQMGFLKEFLKKKMILKKSADNKKKKNMQNYPVASRQRVQLMKDEEE